MRTCLQEERRGLSDEVEAQRERSRGLQRERDGLQQQLTESAAENQLLSTAKSVFSPLTPPPLSVQQALQMTKFIGTTSVADAQQ